MSLIRDSIIKLGYNNLKDFLIDNKSYTETELILEVISNLPNLENLFINNYMGDNLPSNIGQLKQLKRLTLENNHLTSLPESINSLVNLEWLVIKSNPLISFPEELISLEKLSVLYVDDCELNNFPEKINLPNLEYLRLNNNQLNEFPELINSLTNLKSLTLTNNQVSKLIESISELTNLKRFFLTNNQLSFIPKIVCESLINLKDCWVDHNNFLTIPLDEDNFNGENTVINPEYVVERKIEDTSVLKMDKTELFDQCIQTDFGKTLELYANTNTIIEPAQAIKALELKQIKISGNDSIYDTLLDYFSSTNRPNQDLLKMYTLMGHNAFDHLANKAKSQQLNELFKQMSDQYSILINEYSIKL